MADKIKNLSQRNKRNKSSMNPKIKKGNSLFLLFFIFSLILVLFFASIYAGIYFKIIDLPELTEKFQLYNYPIIGAYIPKPKNNFVTIDLPPELPPSVPQPLLIGTVANTPKAATVAETEKLIVFAKQEEQKRINKLARLYGEMNPDDAVLIFNQLDDNVVLAIFSKMEEEQVAKIMTLFDPKRAARLTQVMLKGKKQ